MSPGAPNPNLKTAPTYPSYFILHAGPSAPGRVAFDPMSGLVRQIFNTRMLVSLLMGFACGLPLLLTISLLQAWMRQEGVDLATIGLMALVGLPYTLKFLWAPLLDRYTLPFLGRRRGWMLVAQLCLMAAIVGLGFTQPARATHHGGPGGPAGHLFQRHPGHPGGRLSPGRFERRGAGTGLLACTSTATGWACSWPAAGA